MHFSILSLLHILEDSGKKWRDLFLAFLFFTCEDFGSFHYTESQRFLSGAFGWKNAARAVYKRQLSHARASLGCVFGKVGEGAPTASLTFPIHWLPESGKNGLGTHCLPFCT